MINYATLGSLITPAKVIRCGNDSFPVLSMTMHNGIVMQSERFKKKLASADQSDYKVVKRGQLVVGFPIDEGVLYVQKAADEGIMSPAYNVWDIDSKVIDPDFLELCLHSPQSMQYYKNKLRGTTARRRSIPVSDLEALKIRLPDMQTQHEIVAIIKKAEAIIVDRQEQLDYFEQLVKSRFVELFGDPLNNDKGWQKVLITEVCHAIFGGGTPSKSHPEYFTGSIPWVSPKDMKSSLINGSIDHITEEAIAHSTTNLVPANSVLMVIRSGILKHTLPVAINGLPVTINQDMKAFVPNDMVKTAFLMYYFKAIENDVLSGVRGVTADNIDFKAFQKRTIIVPPLVLQDQFSAFVKQVDKSKLAVQKSLDELETLKKSLMQQYFG